MSFGENIVYYRKCIGITQEELAERLFVSRQTISRWENNSAFPDVETLIRLCDIFDCNMDTLVRGDAEAKVLEKAPVSLSDIDAGITSKYDKHMNAFSLLISLGVALILFGVSLTVFISGFSGGALPAVIVLLSAIAISVSGFIFCGITHTNFMKENPSIPPYSEYRVKKYMKRFPWFIISATFSIFVGIIMLIVMNYNENFIPNGFNAELWTHLSVAVFLLIISVAVFLYVYGGLLYYKYDYNKASVTEPIAEPNVESASSGKAERLESAFSSVIMLTATAIFLLLGFLKNLWHPAWVVFPIGGICCGICSIILDAIYSKK